MISIGKNITSSADMLQKVPVKYVYDCLRNPRPEIKSAIRQLRIIREIDSKQYSALKRQLPYIVCGMFNPPYRKNENFAYTEYFIIDVDHLSEKGLSVEETRRRLEKDQRVVLSFVSPGEDGLKLCFRLKERCYDSGLYTLFYKAFLSSFGGQYGLQQVVDGKTCDVSRACFLSEDAMSYYNPGAETVDLSAYVDLNNPFSMFEQKRMQDKFQGEQTANERKEKVPSDPDKEAMDRIKQMLYPKAKKQKPEVFVPHELDDVMLLLQPYVEQTGVTVTEVINIQYGKKIRFKMGMKQAEVNLFFGKRGFSVVQSPRTGTNAELNSLMAYLVLDFISKM